MRAPRAAPALGTLRRLRAARAASVSVEAALVMSFVLVPSALGCMDIALALTTRARLDQGLQAAVFYAWANVGSVTASGVQSAAIAGYGTATPRPTATATINTYCITPPTGNAQNGTSVPKSGCPSGELQASYLTITLDASLSLPFTVPELGSTMALSSAGTVRIQ